MEIIEHKRLLDKDGVIYSFNGIVCQDILIGIGQIIEDAFKKETVSQSVINKVFSVFTEQMHNIMSYSKDKVCTNNNAHESKGISIIGYDQNKKKYFVGSANFICNTQEKRLHEKLEKITSLNDDEIKAYYREIRRSGKDKHNRGAGLGFLEMAKKSTEQFQYKITAVDENTSFFEIVVYI